MNSESRLSNPRPAAGEDDRIAPKAPAPAMRSQPVQIRPALSGRITAAWDRDVRSRVALVIGLGFILTAVVLVGWDSVVSPKGSSRIEPPSPNQQNEQVLTPGPLRGGESCHWEKIPLALPSLIAW